MAEADVDVKFSASTDGFDSAIEGVKSTLDSLKEHAAGLGDIFKEALAAFGIAFSIDKIGEFIGAMGELGEATQRTAAIFGIATEDVGLLSFAAKETGGNADSLIRSLERMATSLQDIGSKATPTGAAIKALGLNIDDMRGMGLPQLLDTLRDKFSQLPPGLERTAIAQNLARQGAESLLPILRMSGDEWQTLREHFEATGAAMSGSRAEAFATMGRSISTMQTAIEGLGERIMDVLSPAITTAVQAMTKFIESIDSAKVMAAVNIVTDSVFALMESVVTLALDAERAVAGVVIRMGDLGKKALDIGAIVSNVFPALVPVAGMDAYMTVKAASADLFSAGGDVDGALATMNANVDKQLAASKATFASWHATVMAFVGQAAEAARGAKFNDKEGVGTPPKPAAGAGGGIDLTGGATAAADALAAARAGIEGQLAVLAAGLARKKAMLDADLASGKINEDQYAAALIQATNAEYAAQVSLLQKEAALNGTKLAQRVELLNKIKVLEQQNATAVLAIQTKAAEATKKAWEAPLNALADAINAQVGALLSGTESIGQALLNIGKQVATDLIQQAIKSITALAAQAFAGIFAHDAPTLGLGAAATAASGEAAIIAAGGALSGLAVGTWSLPSDGPIYAHKNETVMPAFESEQFRALAEAAKRGIGGGGPGGGGGQHFHFHGAVMDPQSIAKTVASEFDRSPSLRPRYAPG